MDFCLSGGALPTGQTFSASLGRSLEARGERQDRDTQQGLQLPDMDSLHFCRTSSPIKKSRSIHIWY